MQNLTSRYIVGIDLGTTNCSLSYLDTAVPERERRVEVMRIPQLVASGEIASLSVLPSFLYLPEGHEVADGALDLPWAARRDYAVGVLARDMAARTPQKVISSAKSWLGVSGLDRRDAILPWDRAPVPRQLSPVAAQARYLEHLRDAWNHTMAAGSEQLRLENQDVLLTVPASFDAVARELTVEAATSAGLPVRLLEEPQAAFYDWLHQHGASWRDQVSAGDILLVCDIGGGTTDFSLIAVTESEGVLGLERIAVGEHILLGGDNMDLTLAYGTARKLADEQGLKLDAFQIAALAHACREAKEKLGAATEDSDLALPLTILGRGTGVVAGTISTSIGGREMRELLLDGFFPKVDITAKPAARRRVGLRSFGLEYEADPAVTRHLAAFLDSHSFRTGDGRPLLPAAILFNGGVTKSRMLQERIADVLRTWDAAGGQELNLLTGIDPDLAVSRGAAWYGNVQRCGGLRIKSGSARSYYLGIESAIPAVPGFEPPLEALCVINFGMELGTTAMLPAEGLGLVVGEPTEFRFFSSTVRTEDTIGQVLDAWSDDELREMPPLMAELDVEQGGASPIGSLVPVRLKATLTEIGTLQLWCEDARGGEARWQLEFELREEENDR